MKKYSNGFRKVFGAFRERRADFVYRSLVLVFLCATLAQPSAIAADAVDAAGEVTLTRIETERAAVESDTVLDEAQKQKVLDLYTQAGQWLREAEAVETEHAGLKAAVRDGPKEIRELGARMAEPPGETDKPLDALVAGGDVDRLETAIRKEQTALRDARQFHDRQVDTLSELTVGAGDISQEIDDGNKAVETITADLETASTDKPTRISQAEVLSLEARRILIRKELSLLELRRDNHNLLVDLAQARRDAAKTRIAQHQSRLDALEKVAGNLRQEEATRTREEVEKHTAEAFNLPPPLGAIARETAQYRGELEDLIARAEGVSRALAAAETGLGELDGDFERIRQRVKVVEAGLVIGDILRARRETLPSMRSYRRTSGKRKAEISRAMDRQLNVDEQLRSEKTAQDSVRQLMDGLSSDAPGPETDGLKEKAMELVQARRSALNELQKVYGAYIGDLTALDLAERKLISVAGDYVDYIDDQLIRIPDPGILDFQPQAFVQALQWFLSPASWVPVLNDTLALVSRYPIPAIVLLGLLLFLPRKKPWAEARLAELSRDAHRIQDRAFANFLQAAGLTLAISGWPVPIACAGYALTLLPGADPFTMAIGQGIFKMGMILTGGLFLMYANRPDGLGDRHLRWRAEARKILLEEFRWALPTVICLGFLVIVTTSDGLPSFIRPVGVIAFVLLMAAFMTLIYRLLHARGRLMNLWREQTTARTEMLSQLHFLWFPLLLLVPFTLAVLSVLGYRILSVHLLNGVEMTLWFFVGLFLLREFLLRYLNIAERRLRYEEAVKKRHELHTHRVQGDDERETQEDIATLSSLLEAPETDLEALGDQAERLVHGGFLFCALIGTWFIWNDLLLALGFLGDTALNFSGIETGDGGMSITLGNVVNAMIQLIITVLAAKNIPGVLEITLLQRLPLETGGRYALTTLTQYLIVGTGTVAIFSTLGVEWSNIQWLVAALSVGLGFGLQEIVANFISGIILLFERPIRVGDVVTIDDTTGIVSRIRIRATTIVNWEKQELLVPNKDLITGRLTNWTLTNKINRILITVGIAYGSDVALALRLLEQVAVESENIMDDPAPMATFEGFGDNALTLFLRCYAESLDHRLKTVTALHQAINEKFEAAGIPIAFPQRDIHLDMSKPLDVRVLST